MGIARYLRQRVLAPIGEMICDVHVRELLRSPPYDEPKRIERHGFRSFSQNDEDGILQEILRRIGTSCGSFVEFGVGNGLQNNSRLLLYQGWRGLWIECDARSCHAIERNFGAELQSGRLKLDRSFITRDNIAELIASAAFSAADVLSIDIDGNDYWIWEALALRPRVVVVEYNAKFHPPTQWIMEYNPDHRWDSTDYQGASLQSLAELGRQKGYTLVGCSLAGVNAFFVRDDLVRDRFCVGEVSALYNPPRYYLRHFLPSGHPTGRFGPYRSGVPRPAENVSEPAHDSIGEPVFTGNRAEKSTTGSERTLA